MKKLVYTGCSFTAGDGWEDSSRTPVKDSPNLWTNLCHQNIERFKTLEQVNAGVTGASNTDIFQNTVKVIAQYNKNIDTVFCQWSGMPRYNFTVGFELWNTSGNFFSNRKLPDITLNRGDVFSREYIDDLVNRLKVLHHLHWEILKVVEYSNIILNLSNVIGFNVFFINGLCPWDKDYFVELENVKPESYTPFTKKNILNIDSRDDKDIYKLYSLAHKHYREAGGINESNWINLYKSMLSQKIDVNSDKIHPGTQSNQIYYSTVAKRLQELNFI